MLIDLTGRIEAEMSAYASRKRGQVRLSANPSAIIQFLACAAARFFEAYPDIEIVMVEHTTQRSLQLLRRAGRSRHRRMGPWSIRR